MRSRAWNRGASTLAILVGVFGGVSCDGNETETTGTGATTTTGGGGTGGATGGGGMGAGEPAPGPQFEKWCGGENWKTSATPTTLGKLYGQYVGYLQSNQIIGGVMEGQKFIPEHPFHVTKLRVAFAGEAGKARLRLQKTFGRTFPWPWPDTTDITQDLMPPVEVDVTDPKPEDWVEVDVSSAGIFLEPSQHYILVYEHLDAAPALAVEGVVAAERVAERDYSRAGVFFPKTKDGGGIAGTAEVPSVNYRMELEGENFCAWEDSARLFETVDAAFAPSPSPYLTVADFDNDGHDDVVTYEAGIGAVAWKGDGKGTFSKANWDPFASAPSATMLIFGDVDNDGDRDAFASTWVQVDADSDGRDVISEQDCNNAPGPDPMGGTRGEKIYPGATEVMGNGKDDDCDGIADDGLDTSDADGDGFSIAAGDCDDVEPTMFPGNPEVLDALDNDCNQAVDEVFVNRVLINDGTGHFTALDASGVEVIDPSTSGAFGDGNADGKLDLYYGNWLEVYPKDKAVQDKYFGGNGDGTFVDLTDASGLILPKAYACFGVVWGDYDNDGDQDILVHNYHLSPNQLWQNQGDGTFKDVGVSLGIAYDDIPDPGSYEGGHTFGGDFGDVDNDGDLDMYACNLAHPRFAPWSDVSKMFVGTGAPNYGFEDQFAKLGFEYDEGDANSSFVDFDNDGDLDLAIASLYESHHTRLYRNDGEVGFVDVTYEAGISVRDAVSLSWSDVDEDGDMDLLVSDRGGDPWVHLFKNRAPADNGWVELELKGTASTRDAVGARVTLTAGGQLQMREVRGGGGHGGAQMTHWVHFGLGKSPGIDSVKVRWVGGATETFTGVSPNGRYELTEGAGAAVKVN
ncbi:MAG: VCBS repeat-containing protein [Polyangiaceae bacterium]|nr:VCBS repeat-containing protein [Polyangiaceae bacterium]